MRPHSSERFCYTRFKSYARELRKHQTEAEKVFWNAVRNRKFLNLKFRRQHQVGFYIADYYCHEWKLIIELDGGIHELVENQRADEERDWNLNLKDCKVLRFPNDKVVNDLDSVLKEVANYIQLIKGNTNLRPPFSPREKGRG
jgi:type I restriction enzyme, R subunit